MKNSRRIKIFQESSLSKLELAINGFLKKESTAVLSGVEAVPNEKKETIEYLALLQYFVEGEKK